MNHCILVSYTKDEIEQIAKREGLQISLFVSHGQEMLRDGVQSFQRFSSENDVLLVDADRIRSHDRYAVFLKVLEDPNLRGQVWFYNASLSDYPFTIRSRCETDVNIVISVTDVALSRFLFRKEAESEDNYEAMKNLVGYPLERAWEMYGLKDAFVEFLMVLDNTSNFMLFASYLDKVKMEFVPLLVEWLHENELFSMSQLSLCPWLRSERAEAQMTSMVTVRTIKDVKMLFMTLLAHRLTG